MDEPEQNNIQGIEDWVKGQRKVFISPNKMQSIITFSTPEPKTRVNIDWTAYNTNPNGDCMIHALLIGCSPTFRGLSWEDKEEVAFSFRKTVFSQLVVSYYTTPQPRLNNEFPPLANQDILPGQGYRENSFPVENTAQNIQTRTAYLKKLIVTDARAGPRGYLPDTFLKPVCIEFNFNVLICDSYTKLFKLIPDSPVGVETIIIYYTGNNHFNGMSCLIGDKTHFIIRDELAVAVVEESNKELLLPADTLYCEYAKDGAMAYRNGENPENARVVTFREFADPPINGIKYCTGLAFTQQNPVYEKIDQFLTQEQKNERARLMNFQPPPGSAKGPSSSSSSFSPSFGLLGRAGSFDAFPDEETELILDTELKSPKQQEEKPQIDMTLQALRGMKEIAAAKLKKLEFVQWFFESGLPLDCEKLKQNKVLQANINKRLGEFETLNLLDKLYEGIFLGENSGSGDAKTKKQELLKFFTSSPEMEELCKLAKLDLVINNLSKFYEVARQKKYAVLFDDEDFEKGKFIQPPQGAEWNNLLKELQKRFKYTRANVVALLPYLEGSNALLAYRKAATLNIVDFVPGPIPPSKQISNLTPTKWLRELLTTYRMPGFPIQIAIDFEREDISDAFVKDIPEEAAKAALKEDYSFLNGKEFVKNMITNRNIPTTFKLAPEFAGTDLNEKRESSSEGEYFVTQKIPLLEENAPVFISREITEEVDNFERLDKNREEFDQMSLSQVSVPIFIIFSCLKRKKKSRTKIWQTLMTRPEKPKTQQDQAEIDRFIAELTDKNLLYEKNEANEFIYEPFHTSIIFLCNGKIYTIGYGSDPFYDAEQASAKDGDAKIKYLKKMEGTIKNITGLRDLQILGTGFIYSPDSLSIEDEELNYRIVDAGILKKSNIVRLNKILATVKQTRAITMVIGEAKDERIVTVEQLSCQTMCIYSRLATRYTQSLPFASQLMNCSSFVELGFPERINCTAPLGYSDPDACISKKFGKNVPIGEIFDLYFAPDTTIGAFKTKVGYDSDVPESAILFNKILKRVATVSTSWFISNKNTRVEEGGALKLKNRKKQKRPKNTTARKSSNK